MMGKRKPRWIEIEISKENYKKLQEVARRNGLKWETVVEMILDCEVDIGSYLMLARMKLAKRLKIKPTKQFLFNKGILR